MISFDKTVDTSIIKYFPKKKKNCGMYSSSTDLKKKLRKVFVETKKQQNGQ